MNLTDTKVPTTNAYSELYRPQFHYTPEHGWMNDPNGMFYLDGEYHLFYQHYPYDIVWGPMHWGHAVSKDMLHWTQYPIALYPDDTGMIFSGSAVVDTHNTSGFGIDGKAPIVAIYTRNGTTVQDQSIAYSNDKGTTWKKYEGNPVIPNPGATDFRDPKMFWHEASKQWITVLVQHDRVKFYTSPNLKTWTYASEFGTNDGSHGGVWECPDVFPLKVDGGATTKWVLFVSTNPGSQAGGSGTQYFIGDFDGKTFTNSNPPAAINWVDHGSDNYAGVTWSNIPSSDGRRLFIGWMSCWNYACNTPTDPAKTWRSAMTVPRELELKTINGEIKLVANPITELNKLRRTPLKWTNETITPDDNNFFDSIQGKQYELDAEFKTDNTNVTEFGFKVRTGDSQYTKIFYDKVNSQLKIDRTESGALPNNANNGFAAVHAAALLPNDHIIKMRILVDANSVEVFANDGQLCMTDSIFPDDTSNGLELYTIGDDVTLKSLSYCLLNSATSRQASAEELKMLPEGISNHDFETGDLTGWEIVSGDAFKSSNVVLDTDWWGGKYGQYNTYFLSSCKEDGDTPTGELRSEKFVLAGNGKIDLQVGGGNDINNEYVTLCRASDGKELFKATGSNSETLQRVYWDATEYLGTTCYIKIVDNSTGGWGHINVDDINVGRFDSNLTGDWVGIEGNWENATGGKMSTNTEGNSICLSTQTGSNFVMEGDIKPVGGAAGGFIFRSNSNASQFYCTMVDTSGVVRLCKSDKTVLGTYDTSISSDTTYKLKIVANEMNIKVYFNNSTDPIINVNDTSSRSGQFGLSALDGPFIFQSIKVSTFNTNLKGLYSPSGVWFDTASGKQGVSTNNSFLMSTTTGDDFSYEGDFVVTSAIGATGLVFRSDESATKFYCVNIDLSGVVKLWGPGLSDTTAIVTVKPNTVYHLKVVTSNKNIQVYFDGGKEPILNVNDSTYKTGRFGINVWNGTAIAQNIIKH
ncbi:glycoside hydrolase family 32 protein [Pelosinus baikalensis]|uniref:Glycoside hydrolase family 32 protein n=1 Tax=Pelosinus baikalensis TaxID=2892015 RepID=A0ABS8I194_9FIRM|nr:glycoside hydrolase family 32 protein [Pelosinus baikalensis]MCC5468249.1 glycoside hydrolase family 32 protein [Pelosinus baikalensis]